MSKYGKANFILNVLVFFMEARTLTRMLARTSAVQVVQTRPLQRKFVGIYHNQRSFTDKTGLLSKSALDKIKFLTAWQ